MFLLGREKAAWLSLAPALAGAAWLSANAASQDILHLYIRAERTDFYSVSGYTGSGFAARESVENMLFPPGGGAVGRVNFPLSPDVNRLRIRLGREPAAISIVRICLERGLAITRCVDGARLMEDVEAPLEERLIRRGRELEAARGSAAAVLVLGPRLTLALRPAGDLPLFLVRTAYFSAAAGFLFCFFLAAMRAAKRWRSSDAALAFGAAAVLRALLYAIYRPGAVSDSDWFLRYLQFHIFTQPGSRGIVYPIFTSMFGIHRGALFVAQCLLGALGAAMAVILMRRWKPPSRWDILWAVLATSFPVEMAMEGIVLSESLALFFLLACLLAMRGWEAETSGAFAAAGAGCCCALLLHTKPQFAFVALLFLAVVIVRGHGGARWRQAALFVVPLIALYALSLRLNVSSGNYFGTSSTLGYSLFNHGQRIAACPAPAAEPHLQFYCDARKALGPDANTTAYTAWVIFPSMYRLNEPFYVVTEHYARITFDLIVHHPMAYVRSACGSFADFWTKEVAVAHTFYVAGDRNHPDARQAAPFMLVGERWVRDGVAGAWFLLLSAVVVRRAWPRGEGAATWVCVHAIVIGSSVAQAIVEAGENSRYAVPTEPLLWIGIVSSVALLGGWKRRKPYTPEERVATLRR